MTTFQLAERLLANLTIRDWGLLPLEECERVRAAASMGISAFAQLLPPHRQTEPQAFALRAPLIQSVSIVQGAKAFAYVAGGAAYPAGGYASEAEAVGCLGLVSGDDNLNRLHATGTLLLPYLGETGTRSLTLYGDAVPMGTDAWMISGQVSVVSASFRGELTHRPVEWSLPTTLELGTPRYWWTEPLAGSTRGSAPLWVLRVWPVPAVVCILQANVSAFPAALTFLDFHDEPRSLPVTPQEEALLLSLCAERLLASPLWRDDVDKNRVSDDATAARSTMEGRHRPMHNQPNKCGTPRGF